MSRKCQKCNEWFDNKQNECPGCGAPWSPAYRHHGSQDHAQQPYDQCSTYFDGARCRFPATLYIGITTGPFEGRGICRMHHDNHNPQAIKAVIEESERWLKTVRSGADVPIRYTRHDGIVVPGFPTHAQIRRLGYEPGELE